MTDLKLGQTVWWFEEILGSFSLEKGQIYELRQYQVSVFRTKLKIFFENQGSRYSNSVYMSKEEAIEAMRKWLDGL